MTNYAPCPRCSSAGAERLKFTWWGGILGPRILTHVKCPRCSHKYNGKSGKDNTTGIVIYSAVVAALCLGLLVVMATVVTMLTLMSR